ncbi:MAG TPA: YbhB/YbcL family Raf kinase inhibitor-like protein [Rhodocyclaceae bacterium]|nr:YbhB/YbcL family Raf kinase inhibitor-like protein [Rhodocyclaceae bacterium]
MFKTKAALAATLLSLAATGYAGDFTLASPTLKPGGTLPADNVLNSFGCTGGNTSPELRWQGLPAGTRSLALTVYDPDAPTGSGWWHWVVINLPVDAKGLPAGAGNGSGEKLPAGARQIRTDFGEPGYGGACPPPGDKPHRYVFTLHALKTERLDLPDNATAALAGFMINANSLGKATFTVRYGR